MQGVAMASYQSKYTWISWGQIRDSKICIFEGEVGLIIVPLNYFILLHLQKFDTRSLVTSFASLEIHVVLVQGGGRSLYRVFSHTGTLQKKDEVMNYLGRGRRCAVCFKVHTMVSVYVSTYTCIIVHTCMYISPVILCTCMYVCSCTSVYISNLTQVCGYACVC